MRTYYYIHLTLCQIFQDGSSLFGGAGTGEVFHADGHILQSARERTEVLIGQNGGWHKYRHLLAIGSRLESCTHGDLCLSEAHIAAHQTVHGLRHLHIGLHILRGLQLVGGVLIKEAGLQLMLQISVVTEGETLFTTTLGVKFDEVAGYILDMLLGALLHALPLARAKGGETGPFATILRLVFRHLI